MGETVQITICIATFRRPEGLARLLRSLQRLTFQADTPEIRIAIADNDAAGSARAVVERLQRQFPYPMLYGIERERGIAQARNRALQLAGYEVDWIAFIDDDEEVDPLWLDNLMRVQEQFDADVVVAPVIAKFDISPPRWIAKGHSLYRRRYTSGTLLAVANTGNVLLRGSILRQFPTPFEPQFGFIGGEDRHFFQRVHRAGYKIVWADDAIVHEWIPASRAKARWLIKRRFRVGSSVSLIERDLTPSISILVKRIIKALGSLGIGSLLLIAGILSGRVVLLRGATWMAYGIGMLAGLLGFSYREYLSAGEIPKSETQEHDSA